MSHLRGHWQTLHDSWRMCWTDTIPKWNQHSLLILHRNGQHGNKRMPYWHQYGVWRNVCTSCICKRCLIGQHFFDCIANTDIHSFCQWPEHTANRQTDKQTSVAICLGGMRVYIVCICQWSKLACVWLVRIMSLEFCFSFTNKQHYQQATCHKHMA